MSEFDWFVGLYEGEGYVNAWKKYPHRWSLCITSTDLDVLERVRVLHGGRIYGPYRLANPRQKPQWTWQLFKKDNCVEVAEKMLPFLCSRRQQQVRKVLDIHYEYTKNKRTGPGARGGVGARRKFWEDRAKDPNYIPSSRVRYRKKD